MTVHKIEIKQKEGSEGRVTTGANSIILLDGVPLKGVKSFNLEINAGEIAKVTLEMYMEVSGTADTYVLSLPAVKKTDGSEKMKCENCGHENRDPHIKIETIDELPSMVPDVKYSSTTGDGYATLFLSKLYRTSVMTPVTSESKTKLFKTAVLPVLEKLKEAGIEFLGHLVPPSYIPLALVDLTAPFAIFFFPVVKCDNLNNLQTKLAELGLESLLQDGLVNTLGQGSEGSTWFEGEEV